MSNSSKLGNPSKYILKKTKQNKSLAKQNKKQEIDH